MECSVTSVTIALGVISVVDFLSPSVEVTSEDSIHIYIYHSDYFVRFL